MGLPFAFASHFAAAQMMQAIAIYRASFRSTGPGLRRRSVNAVSTMVLTIVRLSAVLSS